MYLGLVKNLVVWNKYVPTFKKLKNPYLLSLQQQEEWVPVCVYFSA